jgi:hypothetical protein
MPVNIANTWGVAEGAVKTGVSRALHLRSLAKIAASILKKKQRRAANCHRNHSVVLAATLIGVGALAASVLLPTAAPALDLVGPGVTGNDTGGIIPWSPEVAHIYRGIAADYCARWNRISRITSVHRRYGDFVGFVCLYDRYYDPRKAWWLYRHAG